MLKGDAEGLFIFGVLGLVVLFSIGVLLYALFASAISGAAASFWILVVLACAIITAVQSGKKRKRNSAVFQEYCDRIVTDNSMQHAFILDDGSAVIVTDFKNRQLHLGKMVGEAIQTTTVDASDITFVYEFCTCREKPTYGEHVYGSVVGYFDRMGISGPLGVHKRKHFTDIGIELRAISVGTVVINFLHEHTLRGSKQFHSALDKARQLNGCIDAMVGKVTPTSRPGVPQS